MSYGPKDRRRAVDARYRKHYNYRRYIGTPTSLIPADEAAAHVKGLLDLGWSASALAQIADGKVSSFTLNTLASGRYPTIERNTATVALSIPRSLTVPPQVDDTAKVPTIGAARRVHALLRLGWTHDIMRAQSTDTTHLARGSYTQMIASRWRDIDTMFRQLAMTTGPSTLTAQRAQRAGLTPWLAWDDIDDPDGKPHGHEREPDTTANTHEIKRRRLIDLAEHDERGLGISETCRLLDTNRKAFMKFCQRNGLNDVYMRMVERDGRGSSNKWIKDGAA
jgi:hypothetical protein